MAVGIRGGSPLVTGSTGDPTSQTLTGTRQPNNGDVLLIIACNDFYVVSNITTPTVGGSTTGVTAVPGASGDGGTDAGHAVAWYYVVTATGDLVVAEDEGGAGDEEKGLISYVLTGADTANPIDIAGATFSAVPSTSHTCPSVNANTAGFMIGHTNSGGGSSAGAYTPPGSMTEQYDQVVGGAMSMTGATEQLAASGATGTRVFTAGNTTSVGLSIVIRAAGGGATVNPTQPIVVPRLATIQRAVW